MNFEKSLDAHFCLLYLKKQTNTKIKILISDSFGEEGNGTHIFSHYALQKVHATLKNLAEQIFILDQKRQNDRFSCAVFVFTDLLDIVHNYSTLFTKCSESQPKSVHGIAYESIKPPLDTG